MHTEKLQRSGIGITYGLPHLEHHHPADFWRSSSGIAIDARVPQ